MRPPLAMLMIALGAVLAADGALAQPRAGRPLGPTIAETGSASYGFERFEVRSRDGLRDYVVTVARPRRAADPAGHPVVYCLDGGRALAALDEPLLARLAEGSAPIIVTVAHASEDGLDRMARAYDYTPAPRGVAPGEVVDHAGRPGGGADAFLDLVDHAIRPAVEARGPAGQEWLWGHSYGGLLVLHAAFTRPYMFDVYVAASPSLWWNYGSILTEEAGFLAGPRPPAFRLGVLVGEGERAARAADAPRRHPMWTSLEPGETERLARRLAQSGVDVNFAVLPDMGHGPMLEASLRRALLDAAGLSEANP